MGYNVGDEVYWNDPDNGLCSGYYKVIEVVDRDILVLDTDPTESRIFPGCPTLIVEN